MKCLVEEMAWNKIFFYMKRASWLNDGEMTSWQNDKLTKWLVDKMTIWQNDSLTKWLVDKMTSWQND